MSNKLFVFLHIPRTGGTTLVRHIEHKFSEEERLRLYFKELELEKKRKLRFSARDYEGIVGNYLSKYKTRKLDKIKIIYGHRVPYGVEKYFGRNAYYFTLIRNPLKRVISLFNFWSTSYHLETTKGKSRRLYKLAYLVEGKVPTFEEWLDDKLKRRYYTNMSTSMVNLFKRLSYLEGSENIGILNKFDFIGITENFDQDSLFLYDLLSIDKFFVRQSVSKKFFVLEENSILERKLRSIYKKDLQIYKLANEVNRKFRKNNKLYNQIVEKVGLKRKLTLPFTQSYYYPHETLRKIKRRLINA